MTRKTVIWIIVAVVGLGLVVALATGAQASAVVSQVRLGGLVNPSPIRPGGLVGPSVRLPGAAANHERRAVQERPRAQQVGLAVGGGSAVRIVAPVGVRVFGGLGLLLVLFIGGGIGALITYLLRPDRNGAPTVAASITGSERPSAAQWQEFQQWQQFEQWHRQLHAAAPSEEPTVPMQPQTGVPTDATMPPDPPADA